MRMHKYLNFMHLQSIQKWACKYILPCICMGFPYICITTFVQVYCYFLAFFDLGAFLGQSVQVYRKTNKSGLKRKKHGFSAAFLPQTDIIQTYYMQTNSKLYKYLSNLLLPLLAQSRKASICAFCSTPF